MIWLKIWAFLKVIGIVLSTIIFIIYILFILWLIIDSKR